MHTQIHAKKTEKGQSLLELGVSAVIILTLLAGAVDLGGLFFQYLAMRDAAQEGAAYISIYPTACNQTIERVRQNLANPDPSQVHVTVMVNGVECQNATAADACASKQVQVLIDQPEYKMTMPFLGSLIGSQTIDLSAKVSSAIIRPPCE